MLEYTQLEYTEKIYLDFEEWHKKDKLTLNTAFPNLPHIVHDDFILSESEAVEEYICAISNESTSLLGNGPQEQADIRMLCSFCREILISCLNLCMNS